MMRRRAFFGGKKEPVYLFKEGTGFIANPLPGVTIGYTQSNDPLFTRYSIRMYAIHIDEGYFQSCYLSFGFNEGSAFVPKLRKIDWDVDFKGYKTLFIDFKSDYSRSGYNMKCGLSTATKPDQDSTSWISAKSVGNNRVTGSFDLKDLNDSYISAIAGNATSSTLYGGYIYNIWLE